MNHEPRDLWHSLSGKQCSKHLLSSMFNKIIIIAAVLRNRLVSHQRIDPHGYHDRQTFQSPNRVFGYLRDSSNWELSTFGIVSQISLHSYSFRCIPNFLALRLIISVWSHVKMDDVSLSFNQDQYFCFYETIDTLWYTQYQIESSPMVEINCASDINQFNIPVCVIWQIE
jgi:hypothetical protein